MPRELDTGGIVTWETLSEIKAQNHAAVCAHLLLQQLPARAQRLLLEPPRVQRRPALCQLSAQPVQFQLLLAVQLLQVRAHAHLRAAAPRCGHARLALCSASVFNLPTLMRLHCLRWHVLACSLHGLARARADSGSLLSARILPMQMLAW